MWRSGMSCRLCCLAAMLAFGSGCANWRAPRIDPTGERIFAPDPVTPQSPVIGVSPNPTTQAQPGDPEIVGVTLNPAEQIAAVGSEVYLVAGVVGADGYYKAHRRLEWTISPGTAGQFTNVAKSDCFDRLLGDNHPHQIVAANYAVGSTLHNVEQLTRGTPDPADDLSVTVGQGWVALTSPIEGDSVVTVAAPEVYGWNCRQKSATIHWLDVNWQYPSPAIVQTGSKHTLTTTVLKQTTKAPSPGWIVRYSIVSGPPAGFSPDGAVSVEVVANAAGQGSAELLQKSPAAGTNQISIEVIRPGDSPGADGKKVVLGRGAAMVTWTTGTPPPVTTGPSPIGPTPIGPTTANPAPAPAGSGDLAGIGPSGGPEPGAGGAVVNQSPLEMTVSEPPPTPVGSLTKFVIRIANRSSQPLDNLKLYDVYDAGLQFRDASQSNHLDAKLERIEPNKALEVPLEFKVMQAGMLCHTVKVLDASGKALATKKACVMGQAAPPSGPSGTGMGTTAPAEAYGQPPPTGQGRGAPPGGLGMQQPPPAQSELSLKIIGPSMKRTVGEIASFVIEITNTGKNPHTKVKVEALLDPVFERRAGIVVASQGFWHDQGGLYFVQDVLPAGRKLKLEIRSECLQASPKAFVRVRAASAEGDSAQGEASCEIVAAGPPPEAVLEGTQSKLQMNVTCPTNPARVNKQFNCLVTVVNNGTEDERNVALEVTVPPGLTIRPFGTVGPTDYPKYRIEKQTVIFEPIASLPPGQPQSYRVLVQTKTPGTYTFTANLKNDKLVQPIAKEATVDVTQ